MPREMGGVRGEGKKKEKRREATCLVFAIVESASSIIQAHLDGEANSKGGGGGRRKKKAKRESIKNDLHRMVELRSLFPVVNLGGCYSQAKKKRKKKGERGGRQVGVSVRFRLTLSLTRCQSLQPSYSSLKSDEGKVGGRKKGRGKEKKEGKGNKEAP